MRGIICEMNRHLLLNQEETKDWFCVKHAKQIDWKQSCGAARHSFIQFSLCWFGERLENNSYQSLSSDRCMKGVHMRRFSALGLPAKLGTISAPH